VHFPLQFKSDQSSRDRMHRFSWIEHFKNRYSLK
jgi:hypothetical protein